MKQTTAAEIVARVKIEQPHLKLAVSASGGAIGVWDAKLARYVMVAGKVLSNPGTEFWAGLEYELLINGKPPVDDWGEA